ncbi:tonB-dependent receptor [Thiohalobacter thiocyanaticus]|uniref:TonB-dependent receptor n=1 Tax=Thiohalobacter thiocyanaticus TaxID=585455 RepID=A0A1Z4VP72_9GAMM|nr:TonB-dependent receptor [Thiohalobacter thiocyanaticus]BAZ93024.1 tonB-dependent receptor [Thiohalobacter thiocyanaticus]
MQKKFTASSLACQISLALALPGIALAEHDPLVIDIVKEAPEFPKASTLNHSTVDSQRLRSLPAASSDTARLLKQTPGVELQGAGGVSSLPSIHGLTDDRVRIKVDGMDLVSACGNHMNPPLSYIDPTRIATATVFAGLTPVSLGGDSIGGTIVVESADPVFAVPGEGLLTTGEIGTFYRSNGDARGANLAATLASENASLTYTGSTAKANNYEAGDDFKPAGPAAAGRGFLDGDEVGSTYYETTNQSLALALRRDNHLAELTVATQDIPEQGFPNQRMDMTSNESIRFNLRYEGQYNWGKLEANAYREQTDHEMGFGEDRLFWYGANDGSIPDGVPCTIQGGMNGCAAGMPMETEGDNRGLVVKGDIPLNGRDLLRVGAEVQQYRLDDWWDPSGKMMFPNTFWNINDGERDRLAAFGEWEARWSEQWLTQFGLRYERVAMDTGEVQGYNPMFSPQDAADFNAADRSRSDDNLDLTALARFTPKDTLSVEFGYARKTRSPNLYERYAWSTHGMAMRMVNLAGDGNGYVGNLELDPEVAHTLSATFDWHDPSEQRWGVQITPYVTYVEDYIDAARCSSATTRDMMGTACTDANLAVTNDFVYLQFVNEDARLYGIDVSAHAPLAEDTRLGDFHIDGVLSYVRGENQDTDDNLYNIMPLNLKLAVTQNLGAWRNTAEVEVVDAKSDVSDTRNEVKTSGYGLLHLRTSYTWKQLRIEAGVENVFDRFYQHPLSGAYLGQGKTMPAAGVPWGITVPGPGRSIYTSLNFRF